MQDDGYMLNTENVPLGSTGQKSKSVGERLTALETRMGLLEAVLARKKETETTEGDDIAALMDKVQTKDAIIVCYRQNGSQTKEQAKTVLKKWGTPFGSWFNGGNFAARLVGKGILVPDGKDENGRTIYTLTVRGRKTADELIKKIRTSAG